MPQPEHRKMSSEICSSANCQQEVVIHANPVWKRRPVHQAMYCEEHARLFLSNYDVEKLAGEGPPVHWVHGVSFDIELLLIDERLDKPCQLFLREVGGHRRLDCGIGIFEASALLWELERRPAPRPLTHCAMASIITALGGRLERVVVDKFLPVKRIYEAKLNIYQAKEVLLVDVRISDGVILAVIGEVPIFVSDEVLRLGSSP